MLSPPKRLRRYTNLAALIHMLRSKELTLLSPDSWDDRNDSHFLKVYKERKKATVVLALCFTQVDETYHHWRVFSHGSNGVCVEFKRDELLTLIAGKRGVVAKAVTYKKIDTLVGLRPKVDELPFIKRHPYRDEKELRIVLTLSSPYPDAGRFTMDLGCIHRISLSPWMPQPLSDSVKETIRSIDGCENLRISRSTLVENDRWKGVADACDTQLRVRPLRQPE
jgi:hypothetical protein